MHLTSRMLQSQKEEYEDDKKEDASKSDENDT